MANYRDVNLFFFFFVAAMMLPTIFAGKGREDSGFVKVDEYVKRRADNATKAALLAYIPNPELVTDQFNQQVGEALVSNSTRRGLMSNSYRDCQAANPIDMCWRCRQDWAQNRQQLAECARGFGRKALGGYGGKFYVVTDPSDNDVINPKPGTLRHAVIQEEPLWIIFNKSMVIKLDQELMINSFKTIDGRGVSVAIAYGAGIMIQFVTNVIIHGIRIHHIISRPGGMIRDTASHFGLRTVSDGDGISIFGSSHIWIDHVSLAKCTDGLIDAIMASNAITISNCQFNNHNDVILLGASDAYKGDSIMQVTVAFNRFGKGLIQRMPRCRWGFFHVVNNLYSRWEMYAIGGSMGPTILSQGNRFKASDNPYTKQVTKRENQQEDVWKNWFWKSEADEFLNGAYFVESGSGQLKENADWLESKLQHKPGSYSPKLTRSAGALKCLEGLPC